MIIERVLNSSSVWFKHFIITRWDKYSSHRVYIYYLLWFNTDTHHDQNLQHQNRWWGSTTSGSSIVQWQSKISFSFINCISIIIFQYRHSSHSVFALPISVLEGCNILLKHYRTIRWDKFFFRSDHISSIISQYRRSPSSILWATKSVMKEHNIWLKYYRITR